MEPSSCFLLSVPDFRDNLKQRQINRLRDFTLRHALLLASHSIGSNGHEL